MNWWTTANATAPLRYIQDGDDAPKYLRIAAKLLAEMALPSYCPACWWTADDPTIQTASRDLVFIVIAGRSVPSPSHCRRSLFIPLSVLRFFFSRRQDRPAADPGGRQRHSQVHEPPADGEPHHPRFSIRMITFDGATPKASHTRKNTSSVGDFTFLSSIETYTRLIPAACASDCCESPAFSRASRIASPTFFCMPVLSA